MNEIGTRSEDWGSHFILVNDINLVDYTGTQFNIIGNDTTNFTGVFDGNNHTISNFTYQSASSDHIGLFGRVDDANAEIKNLTLIEPNVHGNTHVGSLVGGLANGTITNCNAEDAHVSGDSIVGGLVGINSDTIFNCYAAGTVDGNIVTGGLVGTNAGGGEILNCYATGNVNGNYYTGGLVGHILHFIFKSPVISNCYATGNVSGNNGHTGGLVGRFDAGSGAIVNCYATGTVDGNDCTGGLIGSMSVAEGGMVNCYAAGAVIGGDPNTGGLVGYNAFSFNLKCFWDNTVNPTLSGIGNGSDPNVIAKPTEEMKKESTFTNWDFVEIWSIGENQTYPYLRVYPAGDLNHNSRVDFEDFAIFADHWLAGVE